MKECREKKEITEEEETAEIIVMTDTGVITETTVKKDQDTNIAKTKEGKEEEVETPEIAIDH